MKSDIETTFQKRYEIVVLYDSVALLNDSVKGLAMDFKVKERIRELRKEKGETQVQVATAIGVAEAHYQRFERGANLPNLENAWKLADHFGVSVDYLIGRTDER